MGNSPTAITIPDNEVIRDEDVKRDGGKKRPLAESLEKGWTTPQPMTYEQGGTSVPFVQDDDNPLAETFKVSPQKEFRRDSLALGAMTAPLLGPAFATAPMSTGLGLAAGLGGSYAGGKGGRFIGSTMGAPELGEDIGSTVGGLAGGFFGGMKGRVPTPAAAVEDAVAPKIFPKKQALDIPGATSSASPRWEGPVPPAKPQTPFPTVQPKSKPSLALPRAEEPLILSPEEWASKDRLMDITTRQASERGMQYAGGSRTAGPNKPQNRLFPVRQEPVAELGSGIRSSQVFQPGQGDVPQGNPTPFGGMPKLRPEVQQMATPSKAAETPEWMAQEKSLDMERLKRLQREGTPEEQNYANRILKDMQ